MSEDTSQGDTDELEALFDRIAFGESPAVTPPVSTVEIPVAASGGTGDTDELQALFDSVVDEFGLFLPAVANVPQSVPAHVPVAHLAALQSAQQPRIEAAAVIAGASLDVDSVGWKEKDKVFQSVGSMTRQLHDTLCELGYDKLVEDTVSALPDAKDRLAYIANLTEQAACRVLNATDIANPLQDKLENDAAALAGKWDAVFSNKMGLDDFKRLANDTRDFLKQGLPRETAATKAQLLEIMMAQDFQDLTGQVIKKVIGVAQELEAQLMDVLIETIPGERRTESVNSLLNGPVINAEGRADVVGSQQQVDDLLDSLGF